MSELNIVFFGLEHACELFAEIDLFGRRGVVLGYNVRVARYSVDDY
jgi:hypothetical protein